MRVKGIFKNQWLWCAVISVFLLVAALYILIGVITGNNIAGVFSSDLAKNQYEIRTELFMEAATNVGVCSPEKAALLWAQGLKRRNAAMQYVVLDKALKERFEKQWEKNAPNWVTGMSSPWVDSYEITGTNQEDESRFIYKLKFYTATSTGSYRSYMAVLTVESSGDYWRISKISMDEGLYPYAGLSSPA